MSKFTDAATTSHTLSIIAMEEASRTGERIADIDHLFLALVVSEQLGGQVLRSLGLTLETARGAVARQHSAQLASLGINTEPPPPGRIVFAETGGYEWSDRAFRVIKRANENGNRGDAAAVLRELSAEPSGMIEQLMRQLDTSPDAVLARLDEVESYPALAARRRIQPSKLTGTTEAFIPAPPEQVWKLLTDPIRMPEWEPTISNVTLEGAQATPHIGASWTAHARTRRLDGKAIRIKPEFHLQNVELVGCENGLLIEWRFTYPNSIHANAKHIRAELEPAAGGTHLLLTICWERNASRPRRPALGLLMRPFVRFGIWMQLSQLGGGISRAFR